MAQSLDWQYSTLPLSGGVSSEVGPEGREKQKAGGVGGGVAQRRLSPKFRRSPHQQRDSSRSPTKRRGGGGRAKDGALGTTAREMIQSFHSVPDRKERYALERVIMRKAAIASDLDQAPPGSGVRLLEMMSDRRIPARAHMEIAEQCPAGPLGFDAVQKKVFKVYHKRQKAELKEKVASLNTSKGGTGEVRDLAAASAAELTVEDRIQTIKTPASPTPIHSTLPPPPFAPLSHEPLEDGEEGEYDQEDQMEKGNGDVVMEGEYVVVGTGGGMPPLPAGRKRQPSPDQSPMDAPTRKGRHPGGKMDSKSDSRPESIDIRTLRPLSDLGVVTLEPMSADLITAARLRARRAKQQAVAAKAASSKHRASPTVLGTPVHPTASTVNIEGLRGTLTISRGSNNPAGTLGEMPTSPPVDEGPEACGTQDPDAEGGTFNQRLKKGEEGAADADPPTLGRTPSFYQLSPRSSTPVQNSASNTGIAPGTAGRATPGGLNSRGTPLTGLEHQSTTMGSQPSGGPSRGTMGGTLSRGGPGLGSTRGSARESTTPTLNQGWKSSSMTRDLLIRQVQASFKAKAGGSFGNSGPEGAPSGMLPPIEVSQATLDHLKATGKVPPDATSRLLQLASPAATMSGTMPMSGAAGGTLTGGGTLGTGTFGPFSNTMTNLNQFSSAGQDPQQDGGFGTTIGPGGAAGWGMGGEYKPLSDIERTRVDYNFDQTNPEWCWLFTQPDDGSLPGQRQQGGDDKDPVFYFNDGRDDDTVRSPVKSTAVATRSFDDDADASAPFSTPSFLTQSAEDEDVMWTQQSVPQDHQRQSYDDSNDDGWSDDEDQGDASGGGIMGQGGDDYKNRKKAEAKEAARRDIQQRRTFLKQTAEERLEDMRRRRVLRTTSSHKLVVTAPLHPPPPIKPIKVCSVPPEDSMMVGYEFSSPSGQSSRAQQQQASKWKRKEFDPVAAGRAQRREQHNHTTVMTKHTKELARGGHNKVRAEQLAKLPNAKKHTRAKTSFLDYRRKQREAMEDAYETQQMARQVHLPVFVHSKALC